MNPYSRLFTRQLGFFYAANKDDGGGSGGKALTVPQLTQKVKDLEAEKQKLIEEKEKSESDHLAEVQKVGTLTTEKADAVKAKEKAEADLAAEAQKVKDLETEKQTLTKAKELAETNLKTADERAEQKLRELSARNGGTLPPKDANAGNFTGADGKKEMNRAAFDKLDGSQKAAFVRGGGRLVD